MNELLETAQAVQGAAKVHIIITMDDGSMVECVWERPSVAPWYGYGRADNAATQPVLIQADHR